MYNIAYTFYLYVSIDIGALYVIMRTSEITPKMETNEMNCVALEIKYNLFLMLYTIYLLVNLQCNS